MTTAAFLVPRRADGGPRDRLWSWCRTWWAEHCPDIPIVEGHDDDHGLFNRSRAMNRARFLAGDVDVLFILDADVAASAAQVHAAVDLAARTGQLAIGYEAWVGLTEAGTEQVLAGDRDDWARHKLVRYTTSVSSLVAVPAALWDEVGGFDERFEGWGLEDSAFELACRTIGGGAHRVPGVCWHLWHPRNMKADHAARRANTQHMRPYTLAKGNPYRMRKVLAKAADYRETIHTRGPVADATPA